MFFRQQIDRFPVQNYAVTPTKAFSPWTFFSTVQVILYRIMCTRPPIFLLTTCYDWLGRIITYTKLTRKCACAPAESYIITGYNIILLQRRVGVTTRVKIDVITELVLYYLSIRILVYSVFCRPGPFIDYTFLISFTAHSGLFRFSNDRILQSKMYRCDYWLTFKRRHTGLQLVVLKKGSG